VARAPQDSAGASAVQLAAAGAHVEVVAKLLDGAKVREEKGLTALHLAVQAGQEALVERLVSLPGAPVNAKDADGMSALHWAASKGAAR
jgi:Ankyrin repeats (3 copies)